MKSLFNSILNKNKKLDNISMYTPTRDYLNYKKEYDKAISAVVESGQFIGGIQVKQIEHKLAKYTGAKYCIGVSSGTDALLIALMAIGIKSGDEVITVPFTWVSTAEVIVLLGAVPVFVDIDFNTYNMDVKQIEKVITKKTKAIIPVSLFGHVPNINDINKIAYKYNIPVIEDAAQSFGATYYNKKSCNLSTIGCTSFFPTKPLGCYGDGGACFTNDDNLAINMRAIRNHGAIRRFENKCIGINGRLDTIQAAVLLVKLSHFNKSISARRTNAYIYNNSFYKLHPENIIIPMIDSNCSHVFAQYTIRILNNRRTKFIKYMKKNGVHLGIFYPVCLHNMKVFDMCSGTFPISETASNEVVSLPCYPELSDKERHKIIKLVINFFTQ